MKLSQHGRKNFGYHEAIGLGIGSYDFQQEDFVGGVVLTVEEARICLVAIKTQKEVYRSMLKNNEGVDAMAVFEHILKERIEQAEMSKQST